MDSPSILVISRDLIFKSKISALARELGQNCRAVRDIAELREGILLGAGLILMDLSAADWNRAEVLDSTRKSTRPVRLVAYYSHVDHELEKAASDEGMKEIYPRSVFVKKLPELLSQVS